jgi:hypothetical protein
LFFCSVFGRERTYTRGGGGVLEVVAMIFGNFQHHLPGNGVSPPPNN